MKLRIGTRASKLSLAQTGLVMEALKKIDAALEFEVVTIKTKGDVDARPLYTIDRKGIFEKEIDAAVRDGKVDFAVHSLKDVPSELPEGLIIASIPERENPNDVFVSKEKMKLMEISKGSVIGTSSLRRAVQLRRLRPDLVAKPIRGNVETRVDKMLNGEFDAIILAEAGLSRLGLADVIAERLPVQDFVPSPGQGAMAVVARQNDAQLIDLLKKIEDKLSRIEITAERTLLLHMNAGCRFPLGALARAGSSKISLHANIYSLDGSRRIDVQKEDSIAGAERLGTAVAGELEKGGALKIAEEWRSAIGTGGE